MLDSFNYWLLAKKTGWTPNQIDEMDCVMVENFMTIAMMEGVDSEEDLVNFINSQLK